MLINTCLAVKVPGTDCRFDQNCTGRAIWLVSANFRLRKFWQIKNQYCEPQEWLVLFFYCLWFTYFRFFTVFSDLPLESLKSDDFLHTFTIECLFFQLDPLQPKIWAKNWNILPLHSVMVRNRTYYNDEHSILTNTYLAIWITGLHTNINLIMECISLS